MAVSGISTRFRFNGVSRVGNSHGELHHQVDAGSDLFSFDGDEFALSQVVRFAECQQRFGGVVFVGQFTGVR